MPEKTYPVQSELGLHPQAIQAWRPGQAVAVWLSRLSRCPVEERDIEAGAFRVLPDGFHVLVK